jgi:hypothetical protein
MIFFVFIQATSDEITIMWAPPTSNSILVRGYTIGWGKGIPDEYTKVVDNKQRYFLIENLSKSVDLQRCVQFELFSCSGDLPACYQTESSSNSAYA